MPAKRDAPAAARRQFKKIEKKLRAAYPAETAQATFIDTSCPEAAAQVEKWIRSTSPAFQEWFLKNTTAAVKAETLVKKSNVFTRDTVSGAALVAAASDPADLSIFSDSPKEAAFFLLHEAGHLIPENGLSPLIRDRKPHTDALAASLHPGANTAETAGDLFALSFGIREKILGWEDAEAVSLYRAVYAYGTQDLAYATSPAIDSFIGRHKGDDLSGRDPKDIADRISEECKWSHRQIRNAYNKISGAYIDDTDLTATCRNNRKTSLQFALAARPVRAILATGRLAYPLYLPRNFDTSRPEWHSIQKRVA